MSEPANPRVETTRQLAHDANRARHNYHARAVGITDLLIANRRLITDLIPALPDNYSDVTSFLERVRRSVDDAQAAKTDAKAAEQAWLASILPHVDEETVTCPN